MELFIGEIYINSLKSKRYLYCEACSLVPSYIEQTYTIKWEFGIGAHKILFTICCFYISTQHALAFAFNWLHIRICSIASDGANKICHISSLPAYAREVSHLRMRWKWRILSTKKLTRQMFYYIVYAYILDWLSCRVILIYIISVSITHCCSRVARIPLEPFARRYHHRLRLTARKWLKIFVVIFSYKFRILFL